jgi:serine/threonine-protein kinase
MQSLETQPSAETTRVPVQPPGEGKVRHTMVQPTSKAILEQRDQVAHEELASDVFRLRWLSVFGAVAWLAFSFEDWLVSLQANVNLSYFLSIRLAGLVPILVVMARLYSRNLPSRAVLTALDLSVFSLLQAGLTLMCIEYKGIASPYITAVMMVLIARSSVLAAPWRRGLILVGAPLLMFPTLLLGAALFRPEIKAQLSDADALASFVRNLFTLTAGASLCVWGGHGTWAIRRQLFETRSIGKYRLKHCIGRGGMGEVWLAYHSGLRHDVAVKILRTDRDANDIVVQRFEQEVAALSRLTHPNTVRVYDYGVTEDGIRYYAMELLHGRTLHDLVQAEGMVALPRALHIVHQAARALAEAHGRGIIHRDIKPENVFITRAGNEKDFVKVIDFGIAKMRSETTAPQLTEVGAIFGTPAYMSPEAIAGEPMDTRSDVYGLGAVLYFAISGRSPFGDGGTGRTLISQAQRGIAPLSSLEGVDVPQCIDELVMRCLAKDPDSRFDDAGEFAAALSRCRRVLRMEFEKTAP